MSLTKKLRDEISSTNSIFDFVIKDKQISYEGTKRTFFSFFNTDDKQKNIWEIELTLPRIDNIWHQDYIDLKVFLNNCIQALLENFDIKKLRGNVSFNGEISSLSIMQNETMDAFNSCRRKIESVNKNIIFINDRSKIGKTEFMQFCCNEWKNQANFGKLWWLNFNGGDTNICDFIYDLYKYDFQNNNYIIVDNIECCGIVEATKIIKFLIELVKKINLKRKSLKLYIIQNNERKIFELNNKNIAYFDNEISKEINIKNYELKINNYLYENAKFDIGNFISDSIIELADKEQLVRLLFFANCNVNLKLIDFNAKSIIAKNIRGIKLMYDGELISFPREICQKLIRNFENEFKTLLSEDNYNKLSTDILQCFYDYYDKNISIVDFYNILKYSNYKNKCVNDFCSILLKAENASKTIANIVLDNKDGRPFNSHLGAILFAAEALSVYADNDPRALQAWLKLYEHVKSTYYIDGQEKKLPEIHYGKNDSEGTISDFKQGKVIRPRHNCIENQIRLQDEVLSQCKNKGVKHVPDEEIKEMGEKDWTDDTLFNFYITPIQKNSEKDIDIDRFFNTYILALLFEFEVTAPSGLRDEYRIEKLWRKIKHNCISVDKSPQYKYFYPARIPWVTARMLLAMCMYCDVPNSNQQIVNEINAIYKKKLSQYLLECSITFEREGGTYRFWSAGTGLWNSTLETTMLCAFSIREAAFYDFGKEVLESKNFINLYKHRWFSENLLADGIWAYQTTELDDLNKTTIYNKLASFNERIKDIDLSYNETINKNDKSLGISHIAKTLIDLVKRFVDVKPLLFEDLENEECVNTDLDDEEGIKESNVMDVAEEQIQNLKKRIDGAIQVLQNYVDSHIGDDRAKNSTETVKCSIEKLNGLIVQISKENIIDIENLFQNEYSSITKQVKLL